MRKVHSKEPGSGVPEKVFHSTLTVWVPGSPLGEIEAVGGRLPAVDAGRLDELNLVAGDPETIDEDLCVVADVEIDLDQCLLEGCVIRVRGDALQRRLEHDGVASAPEGDAQRDERRSPMLQARCR